MNWYKKSQVAEKDVIDRPSLDNIAPQQWKKINDRMCAKGYDFRGWEDTKEIFEDLNKTTGGLPKDHRQVMDAVIKGQEYIEGKDPRKVKNIFNRVIRYLGYTDDLREAGYILPNGRLLDLSGKKWRGNYGGVRELDHREINHIIEMSDFVSMGAIRFFPNLKTPSVDIRKSPTTSQLKVIWNSVNNSASGYIVELQSPYKARFYKEYDPGVKADRVINDIRKYYSNVESSNNLNIYKEASNWYKKSQVAVGEWWIIGYEAIFADSDVGDMSHSGYVIDTIRNEISNELADLSIGEIYDWNETKIKIIKEMIKKGDISEKQLVKKFGKNYLERLDNVFNYVALSNGIDEERLNVANEIGDAREYGLKNLGWKRVSGHNIQTETLTTEDLKGIASGLYDAYEGIVENEEDFNNLTFTIEVFGNEKIYHNVPYSVIEKGDPKLIAEYGGAYSPYVYASKKDKQYLTPEERKQVKDKFGEDLECSFAKDKDGYYCYTHRARSDSYKSISDIPYKDVEFVGSTS